MTTTLAHNGLPDGIGRFELLRVFEQVARPGFGLSSTAVCLVRHYVLKTMDADFASGRICAVWTQACRIAAKLGLTPRSINSAERELEQAGFIVRTGGINGGRGGDRHDGVIAWAAGINLAPLVNRFSELRAKAEAIELATMAILQCRAEIRQLGKRIRDIGDQALWDNAARILPGGRTARIADIRRLTAIRDALSAVLDAIESKPCASISSDAPEENGAPRIQNHQSTRSRTGRPGDPLDRVTPAAAVSVATETYRDTVTALGGATWPNLVEASWRSCKRLGIGQSTWGNACHRFGRERAALCVLLIDRNAELPVGHRYRVLVPGRCLAGMVRQAKSGELNLVGLLRASQHELAKAEQIPTEPPNSNPLDSASPPVPGPLAHLASQIMRNVGEQMIRRRSGFRRGPSAEPAQT